MSYELEEIRTSQRIFDYLLRFREMNEDSAGQLYRAYAETQNIQDLVKSQGDIAGCVIERYGDTVYLIPNEDNDFLGFSKARLKAVLCKSGGTDRDFYLSQFVILTILVEFYDGQGASSRSREYIRTGELQNLIAERLKEGASNLDEDRQAEEGIAFTDMSRAYEALKSEERGSRAKTTKEGFLTGILRFLEKQGLIEYIAEDEMIRTTEKLDRFMDWNLLNQNHFDRIREVLGN